LLLAKILCTQQQPKGMDGSCVFASAIELRCVLVVEQTASLDFDLLLKTKKK
jgi:hypothetical protein